MNRVRRQYTPGFTAVEVMVTLIIGVILLGGGYQVYGIVNNNNKLARERSVASGYAYDALRRAQASYMTSPCTNKTGAYPTGWIPESPSIPITSTSYQITCPFGSGSSVSKIQSTIKYGNGESYQVTHAIYANKSSS